MNGAMRIAASVLSVGMFAATAAADQSVAYGRVKTVDAAKKQLVLTNVDGKDFTFTLGDDVWINRNNKETGTDLRVADTVSVNYDAGYFTWTARYVLVHEGEAKNCALNLVTVKGFDATKKELTVTDESGQVKTYAAGEADVRRDWKKSAWEHLTIGEKSLVIVHHQDGKATLRSVMAMSVAASPTLAAQSVAYGRIKSIDAEKKQLVLTNVDGKDFTIAIGADVWINRNGKETGGDLKIGDTASINYDSSGITWTARYVLVHEGDAERCSLSFVTIKNYDAEKKYFTITDENAKDHTFAIGTVDVRVNWKKSAFENLTIGDKALIIVHRHNGVATLQSVMAERKI